MTALRHSIWAMVLSSGFWDFETTCFQFSKCSGCKNNNNNLKIKEERISYWQKFYRVGIQFMLCPIDSVEVCKVVFHSFLLG